MPPQVRLVFFTVADHSNLVISPSGRYLAYESTFTAELCVDKYGRYTKLTDKCPERNQIRRAQTKIMIYDMETDVHTNQVGLPDNGYATWIRFANDERLLANVVERMSVGRRGFSFGGARIVSIPIDPKLTRKIMKS